MEEFGCQTQCTTGGFWLLGVFAVQHWRILGDSDFEQENQGWGLGLKKKLQMIGSELKLVKSIKT